MELYDVSRGTTGMYLQTVLMTNSKFGCRVLLRTPQPTVVHVSDMYISMCLCVCVDMQTYGITAITENANCIH